MSDDPDAPEDAGVDASPDGTDGGEAAGTDGPEQPTDAEQSSGSGGTVEVDLPEDADAPDPEDLEPEAHDSDVEEAAKSVPRGVPLRVEALRKEFGGITAVDGATFAVEEASLTGLIGPNGAGKSTTFNCVTGVHRPTSGTVYFQGEDVTGLSPHAVANRGLVRTFQISRELDDMTVLENMLLAPGHQQGESIARSVLPGFRDDVVDQEMGLRDEAWKTLEFFEIDHLADEYAGNLSGGQRKLLELARALMTDPEMLLLDEPFAGVNPTLEEKLLDRIHELREEQGLTFLLVEHDMDLIMEHCEHVVVMHQGRVLTEGTPDEVKADEEVIEAYLGGEV